MIPVFNGKWLCKRPSCQSSKLGSQSGRVQGNPRLYQEAGTSHPLHGLWASSALRHAWRGVWAFCLFSEQHFEALSQQWSSLAPQKKLQEEVLLLCDKASGETQQFAVWHSSRWGAHTSAAWISGPLGIQIPCLALHSGAAACDAYQFQAKAGRLSDTLGNQAGPTRVFPEPFALQASETPEIPVVCYNGQNKLRGPKILWGLLA